MWTYHSPVGAFTIRPRNDGRFALAINDEDLGSYDSAPAAADGVCMRSTGYAPWDRRRDILECPTDLSEWLRGED
jgi:hypothetical protein